MHYTCLLSAMLQIESNQHTLDWRAITVAQIPILIISYKIINEDL